MAYRSLQFRCPVFRAFFVFGIINKIIETQQAEQYTKIVAFWLI